MCLLATHRYPGQIRLVFLLMRQLRGNTSLNLELPPFRYLGGDQRLLKSRIPLRIVEPCEKRELGRCPAQF
jgi:hypothetical protein